MNICSTVYRTIVGWGLLSSNSLYTLSTDLYFPSMLTPEATEFNINHKSVHKQIHKWLPHAYSFTQSAGSFPRAWKRSLAAFSLIASSSESSISPPAPSCPTGPGSIPWLGAVTYLVAPSPCSVLPQPPAQGSFNFLWPASYLYQLAQSSKAASNPFLTACSWAIVSGTSSLLQLGICSLLQGTTAPKSM